MTESQKFVFLYFIQSHPKYIDYNREWTFWHKVPLIKHWRHIFSSSLKDSKEDIELLQSKHFFNVKDYMEWTLTKKSEDFIDEMLCIDEIRVETLKWHLLSTGINDIQPVQRLYKRIFEIWGE